MSRKAEIERNTKETKIRLELDLDGSGQAEVETPIGFFSHMLEAFGRHSLIDLKLRAEGDIQVDQHHTIEDVGLVLGSAVKKALGDMKGVSRAGFFMFPMDDALARAAVDLSGRPASVCKIRAARRFAGGMDIDLLPEFFAAFSRGAGASVHIDALRGSDDHHRIEAAFKAFARAVRSAVELEPRIAGSLMSSKGGIDGLDA
jgi:imidazoleglycerol-phosphate dehydratase